MSAGSDRKSQQPSRLSRILAVLDARNREFIRDRSTLAWNILFPVLVVCGFAFAFSGDGQALFKVGVLLPQNSSFEQVRSEKPFLRVPHIEFVAITDGEKKEVIDRAVQKLSHHGYDLLWSPSRYWVNDSAPKGKLTEQILIGLSPGLERENVSGRAIRYVDWLIAGLLAMNMMFSALFGVGYVIVRYRKTGVLKRLKATPLHAWEFLIAQVGSRMLLLIVVNTVVFAGTHALLHFQMLGSYFDLFAVLLLGSVCLISLGLLVASRISSEEFAGGMLNLITWPMMFLSGVWFSLEGAHPYVQWIAKIFPLTHVIDAARAIMIDGSSLAQLLPQLSALSGMTVVFLILGAWSFRWE